MKFDAEQLQEAVDYLRKFNGKAGPNDSAIMIALDFPSEAYVRALLADLADKSRIRIHRAGKGFSSRSFEVFADRYDDSEDITDRIYGRGTPPDEVAGEAVISPVRKMPKSPGGAARAKKRYGQPLGARPSIEWVLVSDLRVDDTYQRTIDTGPSRKLITLIADNWDWRMCLPLVVSRREQGLFVIDGQHRHAAATLRGDIDQLPCVATRYDSPAEEADMFVRMNRSRRAMNRLDDFHAARVSGDRDAVTIARLIENAGFTVSRRTGSASWVPGDIAFTSAIARVLRKHGEKVVTDALTAMAEAFPDEILTVGGSIFTALCRTLITPPPSFDKDRLFRALLRHDMRGWAAFCEGSKGGDERNQRVRQALLMAYDDQAT